MPIIKTESDMIALGEQLGKSLHAPTTIELIGDVGAGKTTFTKGIARALGITAPITSPSFTLSKEYSIAPGRTLYRRERSEPSLQGASRLVHYDFYRLPDPGIMSEDLAESISDSNTITIVEWAETVADILPDNHITVTIKYRDDNSRQVEIKK